MHVIKTMDMRMSDEFATAKCYESSIQVPLHVDFRFLQGSFSDYAVDFYSTHCYHPTATYHRVDRLYM